MVNKIYSLGGYNFHSAKELAEFKSNFPSDWEVVKDSPLHLSGLSMEEYQDFVDYLDNLPYMPDICLAYKVDRARGHGLYTSIWINALEIRGIFGYHNSDNVNGLVDEIDQLINQSKWAALKIRRHYCR